MQKKKGFTLIELLVVIAIIALLVSILLPSLARARELAKQAVCRTRVKGITTALNLYGNSYNDAWCSLGSVGNNDSLSNYTDDVDTTAWDDEDAYRSGGKSTNLQHYWLLVDEGYCSVDQFGCPSDDAFAPKVDADKFGFAVENSTSVASSYAMQIASRGGRNAAPPGAGGQDGSVIIIGDRPAQNNKTMTNNHAEDGGSYGTHSSVQFIKWEKDGNNYESTFGWNDNDVYEADLEADGDVGNPDNGELPVHVNDSCLVDPTPNS